MNSISPKDLHQKLSTGLSSKELLLDIREAGEFKIDHINGATNMPQSEIMEKQDLLKGYDHVYVYCNSGNRSGSTCNQLHNLGLNHLVDLEGGIHAWKQAGLPHFQKKGALPIIRQVHLIAGGLGLIGTLLGAFVHPLWLLIPGIVGTGLFIAGATGFCGMARVLAFLPWNR